jgi:thiol-disulfide isomerase/thioredoxin
MRSIRFFGTILLIFILSLALLTGCEGKNDDNANGTPAADGKSDADRFPNRPNADTQSGKAKELSTGDVAPEFTLTFQDGSTFRLSDYDDGVVLLNFWATWCGPCVREMPDLQKLYKENIPGVTVRCISIGDPDVNTVVRFVGEKGYAPGFIGYAYGTHIPEYYPSDYIPYTVIIVKGIVRETIVGTNSYSYYKELLTKYAEEQ